ncbi:MAG: hypothetical protein AAFX76_09960 [Planctomycetota bacterium]
MSETVSTNSGTSSGPPTVSGRLLERGDGTILLGLPETDYRLRLVLEIDLPAEVGQKVTGTVHATARRVDVIPAGGRYVEPVSGRPRRVQGRVVGGHIPSRVLYVKAGPTLICTLSDERQDVGDFSIGQLVSFDVEAGAVFKPFRP